MQALKPGFGLLLHKPVAQFSATDFLWVFWDLSRATQIGSDPHTCLAIQFWFVQCLMVLAVLAPVVWALVRRLGMWFLGAVGALFVADADAPSS